MDLKEQAKGFFISTLKHVNPKEFLPELIQWDTAQKKVRIGDHHVAVGGSPGIYIIGTGKASPTMAAAMEQILDGHIEEGMIIAPPGSEQRLKKIRTLVGSHPLPDQKSYDATTELLSFLERIPEGAVVINLVSGGTSSLLAMPAEGIAINELRELFQGLLRSGATIHEINTVRKAVSAVKGGRLLDRLRHTTLIDLVISDVPDDDLKAIGSGPTIAQEISFHQAADILRKYSIWDDLPSSIRRHIGTRLENTSKESKQLHTRDFENHTGFIVSSASKVAEQTRVLLEESGFQTELVHPAWSGPIDAFEKKIKEHIQKNIRSRSRKSALVFYGECTLNVTGDGLGGRNQELALRMAFHLASLDRNIAFLSAGTDGIDGPTDVAGAVVDRNTVQQAKKKGTDPGRFLRNNDSYHFFESVGGHIKTGPTGNNVMDLQIVLIP